MLPISQRLIVSLYDDSTEWVKPYIKAGYPVVCWDLKKEGDIIKYWGTLTGHIENAIEAGYYPYGLVAAPPCTDFAVSGNQWWPAKDASTERCGYKDIADNTVDLHILLVECVQLLNEYIEQLTGYKFQFWALENPVGRLDTLIPTMKPFRKLMFNPCDYGDPYTKKTILWGEFNADLKKTPVEPEYVTFTTKKGEVKRMSKKAWSSKYKKDRSITPAGFARAFFEANQ